MPMSVKSNFLASGRSCCSGCRRGRLPEGAGHGLKGFGTVVAQPLRLGLAYPKLSYCSKGTMSTDHVFLSTLTALCWHFDSASPPRGANAAPCRRGPRAGNGVWATICFSGLDTQTVVM